jgi:hypothetical protein
MRFKNTTIKKKMQTDDEKQLLLHINNKNTMYKQDP